MIENKIIKITISFFLFLLFFLAPLNSQNANEILIYADEIFYDKNDNLIGKGKAKILFENQVINSDLIIYNKNSRQIIIPSKFKYMDAQKQKSYKWNDPKLDIKWPLKKPILSKRDKDSKYL